MKTLSTLYLFPKNNLKTILLAIFFSSCLFLSSSFAQSCTCSVGTNIGNTTSETLISSAISGNSLTNSCLSVVGTVVIDIDFTLTDMEVIMNPGAEFKVLDDITFTIEVSHVHGCTNMWKSISLMKGSALNMEGNLIEDGQYAIHAMELGGSVADRIDVDLKGNVFDKNYTSILIQDVFDIFGSAMTLDLDGNTYDCSGVLLPAFSGQSPAPESRSYAGWQFLQPGFYGNWGNSFSQAAVPQTEQFSNLTNGVIIGPNNIHLGGFVFTNIQADNTSNYPLQGFAIHKTVAGALSVNSGIFTNCGTGIYEEGGRLNFARHCVMDEVRVGIEIREARFSFNWIRNNTISCSDVGIYMNNNFRSGTIYIEPQRHIYQNTIHVGLGDIKSDPVAIKLQGMVAGAAFEVWENTITTQNGSSPVGVSVDNSVNVQVLTNTITHNFNPVGGENDNYPFGILSSNSTNLDLSCNTISALNGSPTDYSGEGIQIIKCQNGTNPSFTPQMSCNTISDLLRGVKANGTNPGFIFEGNSLSNYGQEGLKIGDGSTLESPTGFHDDSGNQWSGNPPSWTADARNDNSVTSSELLSSRFKVHTTVQPYYPGTVDPAIGWFLNDPLDNLADCSGKPSGCGGSGGDGDGGGDEGGEGGGKEKSAGVKQIVTEAERLLANGDFFNNSPYQDVQIWMRERQLYRKLVNNPSLVDDQLASYFNQVSNSTIGQFEALDMQLTQALEIPESQANELTQLQGQLDQLLLEQGELAFELENATGEELALLEKQMEVIHADYYSTSQQIQKIDQEIEVHRAEMINGLISKNNAINTTKAYEKDVQLINDIYLNTIAKGVYNLTDDQKVVVNDLAHQCLVEAGPAVLKARGLYQLIESKVFVNLDDCHEGKKEYKGLVDNQISISPNPATNRVEVQFALPLTTQTTVIISDAMGRQVQSSQMTSDRQSVLLNTSNLMSGIYFVTAVNSDGEVIAADKLMITRE